MLVGRVELMCLSAFLGMHGPFYPELSSFQSNDERDDEKLIKMSKLRVEETVKTAT